MKAKAISSVIAFITLVSGSRASDPTTAALTSGGQTRIAVCFPVCVDSSAVDFHNYTLHAGAASITPPGALLADGRTVLLNVSGLTANTYTLDVAGSQIQTCEGALLADVTLTGAVESRFTIEDVGSPTIASISFSCGAGNLSLIAGGNAFTNISDQLAFAYESVLGDFDKKVQLAGLLASDATDGFARAGLMVRTSIDPGVLDLELLASNPMGDNAVRCVFRADVGNSYDEMDRPYFGVATNLPNQWLRVKRVGDDFQMFVGLDGVHWSMVAQRWQELPSALLVGCYAAASKEGATASAQFMNYTNVDLADHTPPRLVSAGTLDKKVVGVKFSETIRSTTASVLANYTVLNSNNSPATVTAAKVGIEGDAAYLAVSGLLSDTFTVRVNGGISDSAGNVIVASTSVTGKVSLWVSEDIGFFQDPANRPSVGDDPIRVGQAVAVSSDENPEIEIVGGGSNLRDAGDYGHYLNQTMTGDFDVSVEVTRYDRCYQTGGFANAGIMARNSFYNVGYEYTPIGTRVPYYANLTYAEDNQAIGSLAVWRDTPFGTRDDSLARKGLALSTATLIDGMIGTFGNLRAANARGDALPNSSTNASRWLRLQRVGDHFTSYASWDGRVWQKVEEGDHPLDSTVDVGFFTSNDSGNTAPTGNAYDGDNQRPSMYSVVHLRHLGVTPLPGQVMSDPPPGPVFAIGSTNGMPGDDVVIPVQLSGCFSIVTLQFSLHWDPTMATFVDVEQFGLTGMSAGNFTTNNGLLTIMWNAPSTNGLYLPITSTIFAVRLHLIGALGASSELFIDGNPTVVEVSSDQAILAPNFLPGNLTIGPQTGLPPVFQPLNNFLAEVLLPLKVTNVATDPNVPPNHLTFQIVGGPKGSHINTNGVVVWVPSRSQGRSTNCITILATDDGNPPRSTVRTFAVFVDDYLELSLGRSVVRSGDTGSVFITATTTTGVTNISSSLFVPVNGLTGLGLSGIAPGIQSATLTDQGGGLSSLRFSPANGQSIQTTQTLAHLDFTAVATESMFVPLIISNVVGTRPSGGALMRTLADAGRVAVVANEPLLEVLTSTNLQPLLILYGQNGSNYVVQSTTDPEGKPGSWQTVWQGQLTNLTQIVPLTITNNHNVLFFRSVK